MIMIRSDSKRAVGKPATKMLMPTDMNNGNMVGATIAPSQTKITCLK